MGRQAVDLQFGRLARTVNRLKCVHHLQMVTPTDKAQDPRMISRMVEILSFIKPFAPTAQMIGATQ